MAKEDESTIDPMMKSLLRPFLPSKEKIEKDVYPFLENLLKKQELLPGESTAKILLQMESDGAELMICAFSEDTAVRIISQQKVSEFIIKEMDRIFKKETKKK